MHKLEDHLDIIYAIAVDFTDKACGREEASKVVSCLLAFEQPGRSKGNSTGNPEEHT